MKKMNKTSKTILLGLMGLSLSVSMLTSTTVVAEAIPEITKHRLWQKTNYLDNADEGLYEIVYNQPSHLVWASVIDKVHKEENIGYLYGFDAESLAIKKRLKMPARAFALTQTDDGKWLYVGHTQAASSSVSKVNAITGEVVRHSQRIHIDPIDPKMEHLRHMFYSSKANKVLVAYYGVDLKKHPPEELRKLLVLNADTLKVEGEVPNAFPRTGYGLALDPIGQKLYSSGDYINEIDPVQRKVVRTFDLQEAKPTVYNLLGLKIDDKGQRIFATQFVQKQYKETQGKTDGLYVFDLKTGKQLGFVHTGTGAMAIEYSPKHQEIYVANFTGGTVTVVDANNYQIKKQIKVSVFPNMMTLDQSQSHLFVGVKQGFSKAWNPDEFVEGAKEQILSISLDDDQAPNSAKHE